MTLTPNNHTIEKEIRDLKRRISALERQQQDVGDLSEIAPNATFGDGAVVIDESGIKIIGATSGDNQNNLKFVDDNGTVVLTETGYSNATDIYGYMELYSQAGKNAWLELDANCPAGKVSSIALYAKKTGKSDDASFNVGSNDNYTFGENAKVLIGGASGTGAGVLTGGEEAISDDGVYSFTPACARGIILIHAAVAGGEFFSILHYSAIAGTAIAYSMVSGSSTVVTTGSLSGTTGTDGKLTISAHTDGKIYVENRRGGPTTVRWQIVAGSVA